MAFRYKMGCKKVAWRGALKVRLKANQWRAFLRPASLLQLS
jgi:hypothetical protein